MAERRMFSMKIVDSDAFLDMPLSAQALYFHLSMRADDDGFIGNSKRIMRTVGCNEDDMRLLLHKRFLIPFENGVCVIKHWKIHNYIRKDRYKPTTYTELLEKLDVKENDSYTMAADNQLTTKSQPSGSQVVDAGKVRLGKVSKGKDSNIYHEVVSYLNSKAGTSFRKTSAKTKQLIDARVAEGFNLQDFKQVIDNKIKDWKRDPSMVQYLRPITLFGTKFEGYLNQQAAKKQDTGIEWFDQYMKQKQQDQ